MELTLTPIDGISLQRATQLINRSNQFNLTTRRYTETQVSAMIENPDIQCWQARLKDIFGDNGLISVLITKNKPLDNQAGLYIDTWLMSCRVLGRQVEHAILNLLVEQAYQQGRSFLLGEYIQTAKNEMVRRHYERLGFKLLEEAQEDDDERQNLWKLELEDFNPIPTFIHSRVLTTS